MLLCLKALIIREVNEKNVRFSSGGAILNIFVFKIEENCKMSEKFEKKNP